MKGQINIDSIHAFVMRDTDGTEGVAGMMTPGGGMLAFSGVDFWRKAILAPSIRARGLRFRRDLSLMGCRAQKRRSRVRKHASYCGRCGARGLA